MGDRYILTVDCPCCGLCDNDVWFAPTCDATTWTCPQCGRIVDLVKLTGITAESASNLNMIELVIKGVGGEMELNDELVDESVVVHQDIEDGMVGPVPEDFIGTLGDNGELEQNASDEELHKERVKRAIKQLEAQQLENLLDIANETVNDYFGMQRHERLCGAIHLLKQRL